MPNFLQPVIGKTLHYAGFIASVLTMAWSTPTGWCQQAVVDFQTTAAVVEEQSSPDEAQVAAPAQVQEVEVKEAVAQEVIVEVVNEEGLEAQDLFFAPMADQNPQLPILLNYLASECGLARRAAQLRPEQIASLTRLDRKWLATELSKPAEAGGINIMRGIGRFLGGRVEVQQQQDPTSQIKRVQKAIDTQISAILDETQLAAFQAERQAREEFRRDALAEVLVLALDRKLYIKPEQRRELVASVTKWVGEQRLYWQFYFQNEAYIPSIPRGVFASALSPEQVEALQGLNEYTYPLDNMEFQVMGLPEAPAFADE